MFRRTGKNSQDDNILYEEPSHTSPYNKYGAKKTENPESSHREGNQRDSNQRIFDSPLPRPTLSENPEQWSHPKTAPLPHHFEGLMNEEAPETVLGAGVSFRGQLSFERFLRIDGSFEGELLSQGKVVVGPTGKVKANLNLREAIIEGNIVGNITVQEKLELRGEAVIKGDICAKSLCVDEGVSILGHVTVIPQDSTSLGLVKE